MELPNLVVCYRNWRFGIYYDFAILYFLKNHYRYICTMKAVRLWIFFLILAFCSLITSTSTAQCSMCALNAENSVKNGNTQGNGLNDGILYLLAAPYLAIGVVGFIWYKRYRRKNVVLDIKDEKINLN